MPLKVKDDKGEEEKKMKDHFEKFFPPWKAKTLSSLIVLVGLSTIICQVIHIKFCFLRVGVIELVAVNNYT